MRLPVSFVGLGTKALDLVTVRGRNRLAEAALLLADDPAALAALAPGAERVEARPLAAAAAAGRLREAHQAGRPAVRAVQGAVGDSVRALDEIRVLLESNVPVEVVPASAQDVLRWPWQERLPLHGRRIAVTRARVGEDPFAELLRRLGAEVLEAPAQELKPPLDFGPLDRALEGLHRYAYVVLTSAAGVNAFVDRLLERGKDLRFCAGVRFAAVGPGTAAALLARGVRADLVPAEHRGEALAAALKAELSPGTRVLIARAQEGREVLPTELIRAGALVDVVASYRSVPAAPELLAPLKERLLAGEVHAVTFASGAAARSLAAALGGVEPLSKAAVACLGPVTADACKELGLPVAVVAQSATFGDLAEALVSHFQKR